MSDEKGSSMSEKQQLDVFATSEEEKFQIILMTNITMNHPAIKNILKNTHSVTSPSLKLLIFQQRKPHLSRRRKNTWENGW